MLQRVSLRMTADADPIDIDIDAQASWPAATLCVAGELAGRLAGSTEFVADLGISLDEEDDFRATFGSRKLLAYHNSRLLPHEADAIHAQGLRLLDEELVQERIKNAIAHGALRDDARRHAETHNVYAIDNHWNRSDQICLVIGRSIFDDNPRICDPLLRHWGGEAIRGGPGPVPALTNVGTPSIVVVRIDLSGRHDHQRTYPALCKLFVGALLDLESRSADVFYHDAIPARDVVAIWQPGNSEYDRHAELPR